MFHRLFCFLLFIVASIHVCGQDTSISAQVSPRYLLSISSKANQLDQKLDKKTESTLQQMKKREMKMKRKLEKIDSTKAKEIFGNIEQKYQDLEQRLQGKLPGSYIPSLDTAITSLKFLQQNPKLISGIKDGPGKLKEAMGKMSALEGRFQKAEEIKKFLKERKQFLKDHQ